MKIIRTDHKIEDKFRCLLSYMEDALLFDIETTGFSPATAMIYLIGTARPRDPETLTVTQYFAEDMTDEEEILRAFLKEAGQYRKFISFNGDAFDIPFIQKRSMQYSLSFEPEESIDLYRDSRLISPVFPMKSRKLKSIEQFFGIFREDEFSGGDLIKVWKDYTLTGDPKKEHTVLLHNEEDVADMFPVLSILELKKLQEPAVTVERLVPEGAGACTFEGRSGIRTPVGFTLSSKNAVFRFSEDEIMGTIRAEKGTKRYFFGNPKAYRVLLSEEKVIPAALVVSLPKNAVRKARLADCYAEKTGYFCLLPKGMQMDGLRPYRDSFESTVSYIELNPANVSRETLAAYAALLIKGILRCG